MTAITYRTHDAQRTNAQVWRCADCNCFHLLAGQTLVTFTPEEFESFTNDCYCVQTDVITDLAQ